MQDYDLKVFYKNGTGVAKFSLSKTEEVRLCIFDLVGRARKVLNVGIMDAGVHEIPLSLNEFENGIYFLQAHLSKQPSTCKIVLIR